MITRAAVYPTASHVLHSNAVEGLPPLPTAPGETSKIPPSTFAASTGPSRPLPSRPPYKVFIGNVPFDATEDDMGTIFYPELAVRKSPLSVALVLCVLQGDKQASCQSVASALGHHAGGVLSHHQTQGHAEAARLLCGIRDTRRSGEGLEEGWHGKPGAVRRMLMHKHTPHALAIPAKLMRASSALCPRTP